MKDIVLSKAGGRKGTLDKMNEVVGESHVKRGNKLNVLDVFIIPTTWLLDCRSILLQLSTTSYEKQEKSGH